MFSHIFGDGTKLKIPFVGVILSMYLCKAFFKVAQSRKVQVNNLVKIIVVHTTFYKEIIPDYSTHTVVFGFKHVDVEIV